MSGTRPPCFVIVHHGGHRAPPCPSHAAVRGGRSAGQTNRHQDGRGLARGGARWWCGQPTTVGVQRWSLRTRPNPKRRVDNRGRAGGGMGKRVLSSGLLPTAGARQRASHSSGLARSGRRHHLYRKSSPGSRGWSTIIQDSIFQDPPRGLLSSRISPACCTSTLDLLPAERPRDGAGRLASRSCVFTACTPGHVVRVTRCRPPPPPPRAC